MIQYPAGYLLLFVLLGLSACQDDETGTDPPIPGVAIYAPVNGSVYHSGDTIPVRSVIKHPSGLHDYVVEVQELPSYIHRWVFSEHTHDPIAIVDSFMVFTVTADQDFRLRSRIQGHDGEYNADSVFFKVIP
jgi:hypothetical protein